MKVLLKRNRNTAQILITTLVIAAFIGLALGAYLNLMTTNNSLTVRSQVWNSALHVAESGIEEALAYLNDVTVTNIAARNGWSYVASSNAYYKLRSVDTNSYWETYVFTNTGLMSPTILATGYVPAPITVASGRNPLAAISYPASNVTYLARRIKVTTTKQPYMPKGLVIKNGMDLKGNNINIDSYDSTCGEYGTICWNGLANVLNIKDNGDVAIGDDVASVGNGNIKGHLWLGPKATGNFGPNASIGDVAWVTAGTRGVKPGWIRKDSNFILPDVPAPWSGGATTPGPSGVYTLYMDTPGNYEYAGNLDLTGSKSMYIKANVTLWVKGSVTMDSGSYIKMNSTGWRLVLYVSGKLTLAGTLDKSVDPSDFLVYGLPTCTAVDITTGSKMEAAIYAPNADFTMNGSSDLRGSITGKTIKMNGHASFHYDEALGSKSGYLGFKVTSWREM